MQRPSALDTLQAVRDITKTSLNDDTAEALVTLINRAVAATAATFFDLLEVETRLEKEIKVEIANLRAELAAVHTKIAQSDARIFTLFGVAADVRALCLNIEFQFAASAPQKAPPNAI